MRSLVIAVVIASAALLGVNPAQAQPQPEERVELECDPGLGSLRTLRRDQIEAIDESYSFSIWPVCVGHPDPSLRLAGNVGGLHATIGQNEALSAALGEEGYNADDVVGIRFGANNSVIVYVHSAY